MAAKSVLLTGASGLIGTSLVRLLEQNRISTISLHRQKNGNAGNPNVWDPYAEHPVADPDRLGGITGAVHLSGVNLADRRWTTRYRQQIVESRVRPTAALARLLAGLQPKPAVLVSASAVGIYGNRGEEMLTEDSSAGEGFLAETCQAWEEATHPASEAGIRVVHLRFGVVLARNGGALKKMLPPFRLGLGGRMGSGRQWMSWITVGDAIRAIAFALEAETLSGPVNVVAPQPVTNREFTQVLSRALHRPALLPAPAVALRLAFGAMADEALLVSQRALPVSLERAGFHFAHPQLEGALRALLEGND